MNSRSAGRRERSKGALVEAQIGGLYEAISAVTSELSLDAVLQKVADLSRGLVGASYSALGVLGPDGKLVQFITSGISKEARERIGNIPEGKGVLGVVLREGRTLRLPDLSRHAESVGFPPHHPAMKSFLGVPIVFKGRVLGDLYLANKKGAVEFSQDDETLVTLFAARLQAAVAIENALLFEQQRDQSQRLAVSEERERIGRDLHDGVIQSIYAVGLTLEDIADQAAAEPAEVRPRIEGTVNDLNQVIRDIRSYIMDLRPRELQGRRLEDALESLVGYLEDRSGAHVDLEVGIDLAALSEQYVVNLWHILQEAFSNIEKYSRATRVSVSLRTVGGVMVLGISDNGVGFNLEEAEMGRGYGLSNIKDRAERLGGILRVVTAPGEGSQLDIRFPADKSQSQIEPVEGSVIGGEKEKLTLPDREG